MATIPLERQLIPAALAGGTVTFAAALLPFWPPGLIAALALAAGRCDDRAPRVGLALALFVPDLPARQRRPGGRGRVRGDRSRLAGRLLARRARGPRSSVSGPLLAALGPIALLPLAVQPSAGRCGGRSRRSPVSSLPRSWRVSAGDPLPLTGPVVPNLGIDGTDPRRRTSSRPLRSSLQDNAASSSSRPFSHSLRLCCRMLAGAA